MRKRTRWSPSLLFPAAALAVLVCFSSALGGLDRGRDEEGQRQLEEALRRSCMACYAAEGAYPPDLDYLKEHYGIQVDGKRYTVIYTAIAENLTPDITVLIHEP